MIDEVILAAINAQCLALDQAQTKTAR